ncbi:hypothetical protein LTR29_012965 [Friedmanniomyces endolithicus]|nr:hypothetical protein LTR29_012965 [Friedmanniomyces endolithicus]
MEKKQPLGLELPIAPHQSPRKRSGLVKLLLAATCAGAIVARLQTGSWFPFDGSSGRVAADEGAFEVAVDWNTFWDTLPTRPKLEYTPCFDRTPFGGPFQCARLELPMDYWNGTTDATISLAIIRSPAVVPVTDPRYGGVILLNPGGPGGSGIGFLRGSGDGIRKTVDVKEHKYYDLLSFDPRGVGETTPAVDCIKSPALDHAWQLRVMEEGIFEASDAAIGRLWAMSIARSQSCSLPLSDGEPDIRKYVTTASVARDMLEIIERHGEWREKEARRLLGCVTSVPSTLLYKSSEEKIQYWGFSYGTYLGNTFAAMFPDRVGRLIVDGVVDAYDYKKSLWSDNLLDTEKDLQGLYYHCARAGYPACALANKTGITTAKGVEDKVFNITYSLYHNPLPVISTSPEVITYSDVRNLIFAGYVMHVVPTQDIGSLYSPIQSFPYIANLLSDVEQGDGTRFAALLHAYHDFRCPSKAGAETSIIPLRNRTEGAASLSMDATMAIACSDGDDQSWVNRTTFEKYAKEQARVSPSVGSMWSAIRMNCIHYSIRPHYRFEGPWIANTSHPLLLIGNTADPVTPVKHAINMAKGFAGAVALTQDSLGHCSISTYSNCTVQYVRRYFDTGDLPPINTTCPADEMPFGPDADEAGAVGVELMEARKRHATIAAALHGAGGGLLGSAVAGGRAAAGDVEKKPYMNKMQPHRRRTPIWLDCDTGHDDAFAILLAARSDEVDLLGITTVYGNAPLENTTYNTRAILKAIGREDVPVYPGASKPLCREAAHAPDIHGASGLDGTDCLPEPTVPARTTDAVQAMYESLNAEPAETAWLVAVGALTNIAGLFSKHPRLVDHIAGLSIMGGAVGGGFTDAPMGTVAGEGERFGNHTPYAEFNIYCDPEAARAIFSNPALAAKTTLTPLDLTHQFLATSEVQKSLLYGSIKSGLSEEATRSVTPVRRFFFEILTFFAKTYADVFGLKEGPPLHDPLAVAAAFRHELFIYSKGSQSEREHFTVDVVVEGEHGDSDEVRSGPSQCGRTIVQQSRPGQPGVTIPRGFDTPALWNLIEGCLGGVEAAS